MSRLKNRKVWGIIIPLFCEDLSNPYINFGEGRYAYVRWDDFLKNLPTWKIPFNGPRGGEVYKSLRDSVVKDRQLGMLSSDYNTAEFINIFFNKTFEKLNDKVVDFKEGSYLIELSEFVEIHDGDLEFKKIRDYRSFTIKFNTNGVTGFSIWKGAKCLEDRIWSLDETEEIIEDMRGKK